MMIQARVENGVIVPLEAISFAEGTLLSIEVEAVTNVSPQLRVGGQLRGKIDIAPDFDDMPDDLREAFGMNAP